MSVNGIEAIEGFGQLPALTPSVDPAGEPTGIAAAVNGPAGPGGAFAQMLSGGIERLEALNDSTDQLAVKAATGDLDAIHDYTVAATELSVTTQLAVSVRNKAIEAFNEIMRMPV